MDAVKFSVVTNCIKLFYGQLFWPAFSGGQLLIKTKKRTDEKLLDEKLDFWVDSLTELT